MLELLAFASWYFLLQASEACMTETIPHLLSHMKTYFLIQIWLQSRFWPFIDSNDSCQKSSELICYSHLWLARIMNGCVIVKLVLPPTEILTPKVERVELNQTSSWDWQVESGQKCCGSSRSCRIKKLDPWTILTYRAG
jgi:hypothetical protein